MVARTATGAFVRGFNTTITPTLTGYGIGDTLFAASGVLLNAGVAPPSTIGAWTLVSPITFATHTVLYTTTAVTTSDAMPGFAWSDFCWAKAWAVSGLAGTVNSSRNGASNQTSAAGGTSNTGSFTPTNSGCYLVHIGNKNKTSASNATLFSASNGFSIFDQSVGTSTAPAAIIAEWFQSTPAVVDTSSFAGSVADATSQPTQGIKIAFNPGVASFAPYPQPLRFTIYDTEYTFD